MSWHRPTRRAAFAGLLALTALGACGFTPVYAPDGGAGALRNAISFETPDTIAGFRLNARLQERFGPATSPGYTLSVILDITQDSVAITEDGDITRVTLPGTATFRFATLDGRQVTQGTVNSFTSYSTTGTTVATQAAAEDAEARLAVILADLIVTRILAAPLP